MIDENNTQTTPQAMLFAHAVFKCEACQQPCEFNLNTVRVLVNNAPVSCSCCKRSVRASQYDRDVLAFIVARIDQQKSSIRMLGIVGWAVILFVFVFISVLIALVMLFTGAVCDLMNNSVVPTAQKIVVLSVCDEDVPSIDGSAASISSEVRRDS